MINLEQIQRLEARVIKAVELIRTLRAENQSLRRTLDSAQSRMEELEKRVDDFKSDQKDIEGCILRALENLNELEDEIDDREAEASHPEQTGSGGGAAGNGGRRGDEAEPAAPLEAAGEVEAEQEPEDSGKAGSDSGELDIF
jgi:septal ring factor EnvC (AmiA/AmiB activator)